MTTTPTTFELPVAFAYIETTIPAGTTVAEYRHSRPRRRPWWRRLAGLSAA